jgi:hypothetical protein
MKMTPTELAIEMKAQGMNKWTVEQAMIQVWKRHQKDRVRRLSEHLGLDPEHGTYIVLKCDSTWTYHAKDKGKLMVHLLFHDRQDWAAWLREHGYDTSPISKECEVNYNDEPITSIIRDITFRFEMRTVELRARYKRPGTPTAKCYVETHVSTSKSCVCKID